MPSVASSALTWWLNGSLGDTQLFGRSREAFAPRRSLERPSGRSVVAIGGAIADLHEKKN